MVKLATTFFCESGHFCIMCRNKKCTKIRATILKVSKQDLPLDFECPKGYEWIPDNVARSLNPATRTIHIQEPPAYPKQAAWSQGQSLPAARAAFNRADMDAMRDNARWASVRTAILSRGLADLHTLLAAYDAKYAARDMQEPTSTCTCQGRVNARAVIFTAWRAFLSTIPETTPMPAP